MRHLINDDNTPKGVEGWYDLDLKDDTIVVYLNSTSPGIDWLIDCLAFPVPIDLTDPFGPWCHVGFKRYAYWLTGLIYALKLKYGFKNVLLIGYSMGGGIAQLAGLICEAWLDVNVRVVSIDGPRTTSRLPENIRLYYNAGSAVNGVPFWFPGIENKICCNDRWRWFWESHGDYDEEAIIKKELAA